MCIIGNIPTKNITNANSNNIITLLYFFKCRVSLKLYNTIPMKAIIPNAIVAIKYIFRFPPKSDKMLKSNLFINSEAQIRPNPVPPCEKTKIKPKPFVSLLNPICIPAMKKTNPKKNNPKLGI